MLDRSLLEQPTDLPAVHRIAGKTIQFPTDNALRLAFLYASHHLIEDGAAGHLGGLLLDEFRRRSQYPRLWLVRAVRRAGLRWREPACLRHRWFCGRRGNS